MLKMKKKIINVHHHQRQRIIRPYTLRRSMKNRWLNHNPMIFNAWLNRATITMAIPCNRPTSVRNQAITFSNGVMQSVITLLVRSISSAAVTRRKSCITTSDSHRLDYPLISIRMGTWVASNELHWHHHKMNLFFVRRLFLHNGSVPWCECDNNNPYVFFLSLSLSISCYTHYFCSAEDVFSRHFSLLFFLAIRSVLISASTFIYLILGPIFRSSIQLLSQTDTFSSALSKIYIYFYMSIIKASKQSSWSMRVFVSFHSCLTRAMKYRFQTKWRSILVACHYLSLSVTGGEDFDLCTANTTLCLQVQRGNMTMTIGTSEIMPPDASITTEKKHREDEEQTEYIKRMITFS